MPLLTAHSRPYTPSANTAAIASAKALNSSARLPTDTLVAIPGPINNLLLPIPVQPPHPAPGAPANLPPAFNPPAAAVAATPDAFPSNLREFRVIPEPVPHQLLDFYGVQFDVGWPILRKRRLLETSIGARNVV